jgi:hypothetical protein
MGYYVSNMFGMRMGGVFGGEPDMDSVKAIIRKLVLDMRAEEKDPDLGNKDGDVSHCLSAPLVAHKGTYCVIAGVFNYWTYPASSEFARRLSDVLGTEVMHMCWDEERDEVQCNIWLAGKPLLDVNEHPIGQMLRRIG